MTRYALLAAIAAAAALGWYYFNRIAAPQGEAGAPIVAVTMPEITGEARLGQRAFVAKCAACHGPDAGGRNGLGPPLVHKIYEPSHHGDAAFLLAAQNGVRSHHWPFGNMPPVEGITRAEVISIVAYVRTLQRANGID